MKFDLKTPGREDDDDNEAEKSAVLSNDDFTEVAKIILEGVGGKERTLSLSITALQDFVLKSTIILRLMRRRLNLPGSRCYPSFKTAVQVIVGMKVQFVADEFKKLCK